jgi:hypothetical protein
MKKQGYKINEVALPFIQTIIQAQKLDGWIDNNFHGESKALGAGMFHVVVNAL